MERNKIYDPKKRQYKCKSISAADWNEQTKAEEWRAAWAQLCNQALEQNGHAERINHCSYLKKHIEQVGIYFKYKGKSSEPKPTNPAYGGERLSQGRDERQNHNSNKDMENRV